MKHMMEYFDEGPGNNDKDDDDEEALTKVKEVIIMLMRIWKF